MVCRGDHWSPAIYGNYPTNGRSMIAPTGLCVAISSHRTHRSIKIESLSNEKRPLSRSFFVIASVSRGLSGTVIYLRLTSPPSFGFRRATRGYASGKRSSYGVASDRVYSKCTLPYKWVSSYLTFPPLPLKRRFISVALSRESPLADVISYPAL